MLPPLLPAHVLVAVAAAAAVVVVAVVVLLAQSHTHALAESAVAAAAAAAAFGLAQCHAHAGHENCAHGGGVTPGVVLRVMQASVNLASWQQGFDCRSLETRNVCAGYAVVLAAVEALGRVQTLPCLQDKKRGIQTFHAAPQQVHAHQKSDAAAAAAVVVVHLVVSCTVAAAVHDDHSVPGLHSVGGVWARVKQVWRCVVLAWVVEDGRVQVGSQRSAPPVAGGSNHAAAAVVVVQPLVSCTAAAHDGGGGCGVRCARAAARGYGCGCGCGCGCDGSLLARARAATAVGAGDKTQRTQMKQEPRKQGFCSS